MPSIAEVILELAIPKPLDYAIPDHLKNKVHKGSLVKVPVRGQIAQGFVVELKMTSAHKKLRPIDSVILDQAPLTNDLFELALWMAKYYACPLGKVLKTMLPSGVRKNTQRKMQHVVFRAKTKDELVKASKDLLKSAPQQANALNVLLKTKKSILLSELLEQAECHASSIKALEEKGYITIDIMRLDQTTLQNAEYFKTKPKRLNPEQEIAFDEISKTIASENFKVHLLYGVTGSGKTEVYLQAIQKVLEQNKGVIVLVPEIALTPQTIQRLTCRFDVPITALHHRLSDGERHDAWQKIQSGKSPIVIGARSCVFSPVPNLGLIVVDEEHEHSYKQQDDMPCYNARDVAIVRAKFCNAAVILGSATPSIESFYNTESNKYVLNTLFERNANAELPLVHIVDMKREYEKAQGMCLFSELLLNKLDDRKKRGEKSILFLNRRGYHTVLQCSKCQKAVECPHCDTSLTFHLSQNEVNCHLCGFSTHPKIACSSCKSNELIQFKGFGTEKVEMMLQKVFPDIRCVRIDADTTKHKGKLEKLIHDFRSGKADVLIGTQMVAKGLHFPDVTLVGVLNTDAGLHIPDFRAQETVFQLITQVSGRAGRSELKGEVIIQTAQSENETIHFASKQDFISYYKSEKEIRKLFQFPPFCHIVKFLFTSKNENALLDFSQSFFQEMQKNLPSQYICHPVVPSGHYKVKDCFRVQFLIRGASVLKIIDVMHSIDTRFALPSSIKRFVDVDPLSTFF